jgi:hypothetical protein
MSILLWGSSVYTGDNCRFFLFSFHSKIGLEGKCNGQIHIVKISILLRLKGKNFFYFARKARKLRAATSTGISFKRLRGFSIKMAVKTWKKLPDFMYVHTKHNDWSLMGWKKVFKKTGQQTGNIWKTEKCWAGYSTKFWSNTVRYETFKFTQSIYTLLNN